MSLYLSYYDAQVGGGGHSLKNVYSGGYYQRGHGVGSWFKGVVRRIIPYISQGMKAVGKEALLTGLNVFDDVVVRDGSFKDAVKKRGREAGARLKNKAKEKVIKLMKGRGYKARSSKRRRQSGKKRAAIKSGAIRKKKKRRVKKNKGKKKSGARKSSKKKGFRDISDIFGPK